MTNQWNYYDILSTLILGTLFLCSVLICFPQILSLSLPPFPEAFSVIALTGLAVFLGQFIQAVSSLLEPSLHWLFRGRPSDVALAKGLGHYLPLDSAIRIRAKLKSAAAPDATDRSLFLFALQNAVATGTNRAERFNSLYAYHRGLLVLLLLVTVVFILSFNWGIAKTWSASQRFGTLAFLTSVFLIVLYRTKQRAFYYVRTVLLEAEQALDSKAASSAGANIATKNR